ncbi:MAG: hypothetical protein ABII81_09570 [Pseudomonadota bacterium]
MKLGQGEFCLKAVVGKSSVKTNNFRNNKLAYADLLTPRDIE